MEVDADDEQAYVGGRTFDAGVPCGWQHVLLHEGVGDGLVAVLLSFNEEHGGWGWLYEWDGDGYEMVRDEGHGYRHEHVDAYRGEDGLYGLDLAEAFAELRDVRPARFAPAVHGGVRKPDDDDYVPRSVRDERRFDV